MLQLSEAAKKGGEEVNQANNEKPFGLLSPEEQEQFCEKTKSLGGYEYYGDRGWKTANIDPEFHKATVYRLKIQLDRWYWIVDDRGECSRLGDFINYEERDRAIILRPAIAKEIPEQEKTLKERIEEEYSGHKVIMLKWSGVRYVLEDTEEYHVNAYSLKCFYKYVYEIKDTGNLEAHGYSILHGIDSENLLPVAVLFKKGDE